MVLRRLLLLTDERLLAAEEFLRLVAGEEEEEALAAAVFWKRWVVFLVATEPADTYSRMRASVIVNLVWFGLMWLRFYFWLIVCGVDSVDYLFGNVEWFAWMIGCCDDDNKKRVYPADIFTSLYTPSNPTYAILTHDELFIQGRNYQSTVP